MTKNASSILYQTSLSLNKQNHNCIGHYHGNGMKCSSDIICLEREKSEDMP